MQREGSSSPGMAMASGGTVGPRGGAACAQGTAALLQVAGGTGYTEFKNEGSTSIVYFF